MRDPLHRRPLSRRVLLGAGALLAAPSMLMRRTDAAETCVNRFYRLDRSFELAGMTDHVGIREIHDDGVEFALFNRFHHGVGNAFGGHFRL